MCGNIVCILKNEALFVSKERLLVSGLFFFVFYYGEVMFVIEINVYKI